MSYFQAVRFYCPAEVCVLTALIVIWIGGLSEDAEPFWAGPTASAGSSSACSWPTARTRHVPLGAARGDRLPARPDRLQRGNRVSGPAAPGSLPGLFPLNLPNALTLVRILLVPVLVVALTVETPGGSTIAAIVFAIAALTDGLDGYIARSRQSVTTFGKVMDPVADKLMIAAALISLVSLERLAAWVAMVIIAREFAVSGLRIAAGQQGVVIPASGLGKVKTIVQVVAVLALIAAKTPRRLGAGARLPDGGDHRRLGRRLLPQLPAPPARRRGATAASAARQQP